MKQKYVKIKNKWYFNHHTKNPNVESNYFTDNEAMILNLGEETKEVLLQQNNRKAQPILIIIDGVDGVGKTTIVNNIIEKIKTQKLEIISILLKGEEMIINYLKLQLLKMNGCFVKK